MKKKLRNFLIVTSLIAVFAALLFLHIMSERVTMNPAGTIGNTAGNLNNHGLFCEYNGRVYFSNSYDGGALYSMNPDETDLKKLGEMPVELINAGGKYLYYFQTSAGGGSGLGYMRTRYGIYRSELNGKKVVNFNTDTAFSIQLIDNYLYYLVSDEKGPHFYKQKIDRSETVLLSDTIINPACVVNGSIYFNGTQEDHALYSLQAENDTVSTVWEGNLWYPIVEGGYVYYLDLDRNYSLCRYSLSDKAIEILTNDRVDTYNLYGNWIYYQKNSSTEPCLKRMNLDGSNAEIIAKGNYSDINITSQYVYFHEFGNSTPIYRTPLNGSVNVTTFDAAFNAAVPNK